MLNVGGITVFGGTYPARIWAAFTEGALIGQPAVDFPAPNPRKMPEFKIVTSPALQHNQPFSTPPTTKPRTTTTLPGPATTSPPSTSPPTTGPPPTGPPTTRPRKP